MKSQDVFPSRRKHISQSREFQDVLNLSGVDETCGDNLAKERNTHLSVVFIGIAQNKNIFNMKKFYN